MKVRTEELQVLLRRAAPTDDNIRTACILIYNSGHILNGSSIRAEDGYIPAEVVALAGQPRPHVSDRILEIHLMSSASGLCGIERALPVPKSMKVLTPSSHKGTKLYLYSKGATEPVEIGSRNVWLASQITGVQAPMVGNESELYWGLEKGNTQLKGRDIDLVVCFMRNILRRDANAKFYLSGPCSGQNDRLAVLYNVLLESNYLDVHLGVVSTQLNGNGALNAYARTLRQMRIADQPLTYTEWHYRDQTQSPPRDITTTEPIEGRERELLGYSHTVAVQPLLPQTETPPFYRASEHLSRFKIRVGATLRGALGTTVRERNCYRQLILKPTI
jgi:hypothetical protein